MHHRSALCVSVVVLLLAALLYVEPARRTPFFTKGEPREALVVQRMVKHGDWLLPMRASSDGLTIASKPPMFHWMSAFAARASGVLDEWTLRLPSVALASATVALVWLVARTIIPPPAAFMGAVVLASSFEWVRAATSARVDATLAAFMTMALLAFWMGVEQGQLSRRGAIVAYGSLAAAVLTKGPVGVLVPALVLGAALLLRGDLRLVARLRPVSGGLAVVAVAGGWYLAATWLGGEPFVEKHLLKENVFRFVGATRLQSGHTHPVYYYLPTLAAGLLPWTPFVIGALVQALRRQAVRHDPARMFLFAWFLVVLVFYSLSSAKRSVYLLALYPPAGLLGGWWWWDLCESRDIPTWTRHRVVRAAATILCVAGAIPIVVALGELAGMRPLDLIGILLKPKDRERIATIQDIIRQHPAVVLTGFAITSAALVAAVRAAGRERWRQTFAATTMFAIALWVLVFSFFQPALAERRSLKPFLAFVRERTHDESLAFHKSTFDFGAAFYAARDLPPWDGSPGPGGTPAYVLIWDRQLDTLPAATRQRLVVVGRSEGTDPRGRRRLLLARVR